MSAMKTWVYLNKEGEKYLVVHRNPNDLTWEHPYFEKTACGACQGTSTAAPLETP